MEFKIIFESPFKKNLYKKSCICVKSKYKQMKTISNHNQKNNTLTNDFFMNKHIYNHIINVSR